MNEPISATKLWICVGHMPFRLLKALVELIIAAGDNHELQRQAGMIQDPERIVQIADALAADGENREQIRMPTQAAPEGGLVLDPLPPALGGPECP